jgi:hypothetical protein
LIFSGNDKQRNITVTDSTELNPDNLFDDPFVILSQPSLQDLIESEPSAGDDPPPMSPTITISPINVELITSSRSMINNKSSNRTQTLPTTRPINKKEK